ncbi:uncharacterized protein N7477_005981 [Penicillium maclennaniae]|uniref:uncharacterized protein n=1 Tax=Penicillium maclennaniae TaxID=1343394 RepID=UPI0025406C43|nr:uncharacterized protein N7477_005981 [Penicillium maclennaniae]KAJ5670618.1 hypothetical protein N7477_005981 [Penicillium maclennaniae]
MIARNLLQKLCSNSAKRNGIEPNDVQDTYAEIDHWRNHACAPHLRRHEESPGILPSCNLIEVHSNEMQINTRFDRAALWALKINCLMHVESSVSDFGLNHNDHLRAEMTTARVEYEILRALNDMIAICRWTDMHVAREVDGKQHSLIDLEPLALRNVGASLCFGHVSAASRLVAVVHPAQCNIPILKRLLTDIRIKKISGKPLIYAYIKNAQVLRDAAAIATSHRDPADVLKRLDKEIALLKADLDNAPGAK